MFRAEKDERLQLVNYKAGYYAFAITSGLLLAGMFVDRFLDSLDWADHTLLMFIPWFVGVWVYVILLLRDGYLSAVREESTRTSAGMRKARASVVAEGVLFGAVLFAIRRIFPGSSGRASIGDDLFTALVAAVVMSIIAWWLTARKVKTE